MMSKIKKIPEKVMGIFQKDETTAVDIAVSEMQKISYRIENENVDHDLYMSMRRKLNLLIISAVCGAEVKTNKEGVPSIIFQKKNRIKASELALLMNSLESFIIDVEEPFLVRSQEISSATSDGMDIPDNIYNNSAKLELKKVNEKEFDKAIFGKDGKNAFLNVLINNQDILNLLVMGEYIMSKKNLKRIIIVAGVVVVVGAAAVVAKKKYDEYKESKENDEIDDNSYPEESDDDMLDDMVTESEDDSVINELV